MISSTLACGPDASTLVPFLLIGAWFLCVFKFFLYYAFAEAFRYRVSAPVPLTSSRIWTIAGFRAGIGVVVIGGAWLLFYASSIGNDDAITAVWIITVCERLVVWFLLGRFLAKLAGRRLVGWTLSGTGIDVACDLGLYFLGGVASLLSPIIALGCITVFIAGLIYFGRRESLRYRFASLHHCKSCGYDLTATPFPVCPECGVERAAVPS